MRQPREEARVVGRLGRVRVLEPALAVEEARGGGVQLLDRGGEAGKHHDQPGGDVERHPGEPPRAEGDGRQRDEQHVRQEVGEGRHPDGADQRLHRDQPVPLPREQQLRDKDLRAEEERAHEQPQQPRRGPRPTSARGGGGGVLLLARDGQRGGPGGARRDLARGDLLLGAGVRPPARGRLWPGRAPPRGRLVLGGDRAQPRRRRVRRRRVRRGRLCRRGRPRLVPRRRVWRRAAADGRVDAESHLDVEHHHQVADQDEVDLLHDLHADGGGVCGVAREVEVDVGPGEVAVRVVAHDAARPVERDGDAVRPVHHTRPRGRGRHLADLLGVEAVAAKGVREGGQAEEDVVQVAALRRGCVGERLLSSARESAAPVCNPEQTVVARPWLAPPRPHEEHLVEHDGDVDRERQQAEQRRRPPRLVVRRQLQHRQRDGGGDQQPLPLAEPRLVEELAEELLKVDELRNRGQVVGRELQHQAAAGARVAPRLRRPASPRRAGRERLAAEARVAADLWAEAANLAQHEARVVRHHRRVHQRQHPHRPPGLRKAGRDRTRHAHEGEAVGSDGPGRRAP
mmetsp:Transcript_4073/g.11960  ORF Transcript_4073/g.11960 Transcript_4073/m.11960 type:complete len:570 (-) Transcript_4073:304-2013(-)